MPTRILIPSGVLGLKFDSEALARGVENCPDAICIDGGSTDSGPFYLGTGASKYSELATRAQWRELMLARQELGVPLVIGSCGTCGSDDTVDWMFELTRQIARELGQSLKVARLYCSQSKERIKQSLHRGEVAALTPELAVDEQVIESCTNIVALAGVEQINSALATGADIVLAGRTTDTAVIAAIPIARGEHVGAAWHGAKIGECGALCSTHPVSGVIEIEFDRAGFTVCPLAEGAKCTPYSVSAHMLYENADPLRLIEPGGTLNVSAAVYEAVDSRSVRVIGSEWESANRYTVKLEGARRVGYQTSALVMLRQARYVRAAKQWCEQLHEFLCSAVEQEMSLARDEYDLEFRVIGIDATLGELENLNSQPSEVGVLMLVTGQSQEQASDIARLCNPYLLHYPLTSDEELPTFAFPYSPAESERGALYEFSLNHVMQLHDPMDAFRIDVEAVNYAQD